MSFFSKRSSLKFALVLLITLSFVVLTACAPGENGQGGENEEAGDEPASANISIC